MSEDISGWLEGIGLGRFREAFVANEVDLEVLPHLSEADLKELGLPLGARRKLQLALGVLEKPIRAREGSDRKESSQRVVSAPAAAQAVERRQMTVMFCDLAGSTALSNQVDAEDMVGILRAFQDASAKEIERYGGFVAKFMGDGVLAYFGYPEAHENDVERSILAGLGIVERMASERSEQGAMRRPPVRIGIATGLVVVGDVIGQGASQEAAVTGTTPNLAARLQGLAEPDSVVIDEASTQLAGGMFDLRQMGSHQLKGFAESREVFAVVGRGRATSRFEAARKERLGKLVGRDEELELLVRRWDRVRDGKGQLVLLGGEPGIGKSRLIHALSEHIRGESHLRLTHQCSPFHSNTALYPMIERIEREAGFEPSDNSARRLDKLEVQLRLIGRPLHEDMPLLADLLSVPVGDRYPSPSISPQRRKQLTIEMLAEHLEHDSAREPVLFVLEDAHWIDPTTLELLDCLVDRLDTWPVLMIVTHRPVFAAPWAGRSQVTQLALRRLDHADSATLVEQAGSGLRLPAGALEQIVAKTDGVPLFVEEFTRAVAEAGRVEDAWSIPATLKDALESRLARLGDGREVAQVAASIGRSFGYRLLAAVDTRGEERLRGALEELVASELLFVRGEIPESTYTFKHALVQDTAYESLLREQRREIHARIAEVLEREFPSIVSEEPEILAHHFTAAEELERAVPYWQSAGEIAARRSALQEAIHHYAKAIELVRSQPSSEEATRQELALQLQVAPVYMAAVGFGAPEVAEAYQCALDLARKADEQESVFAAQWGLWMVGFVTLRGNEQEMARELQVLSKQSGEPGQRLQAHHACWSTAIFRGEFAAACEYVEDGLAIYDVREHAGHKFLFGGHDPGVCGQNFLSLAQCLMGRFEASAEQSARALVMADEVDHPLTSIASYTLASMLQLLRRDAEFAEESLERAILIAKEHKVPCAMWADAMHGWIKAERGQSAEGVERMQRSFSETGAVGQEPFRPFYLGLMGEFTGRDGRAEEGIRFVDEGLAMAERSARRWCLAELKRIRGELLARGGGSPDEIESCFREALELSERQQAGLWKLRAATAFSRWLVGEGRAEEAHRLLAMACRDSKQGGEAADHHDAKVLLQTIKG